MIIRPRAFPFFILTLASILTNADDTTPFDCHVTVGALTFDLTSLDREYSASRTRTTPPTTMVDSLSFNICNDLKPQSGVAEQDQCPTGTRACLTKTNKKDSETDRIVAVIPLAQTKILDPKYSASASPTKYLSILLKGPTYSLLPQSLNLTLFCDSEGISEPKFVGYDGSQLDLEWSAPAGCAVVEGDKSPPSGGGNNGEDGSKDGEEKDVGSGVGWFFLALILAFMAYFGLGAYYNYSTYGARGADLIPHRDFWKEVPYMLADVVSHLCSSVRPRRTASRGGYISV